MERTPKGINLVLKVREANHLSSETIEETKQPLIVIALLLRKGNKVLTITVKRTNKRFMGIILLCQASLWRKCFGLFKEELSRHLGYELGNKVNLVAFSILKLKIKGKYFYIISY